MTPETKPTTKAPLPFDTWKLQLRNDCELCDRLPGFDALGDAVLRLFWESGADPTVQAIIDGASDGT